MHATHQLQGNVPPRVHSKLTRRTAARLPLSASRHCTACRHAISCSGEQLRGRTGVGEKNTNCTCSRDGVVSGPGIGTRGNLRGSRLRLKQACENPWQRTCTPTLTRARHTHRNKLWSPNVWIAFMPVVPNPYPPRPSKAQVMRYTVPVTTITLNTNSL